MTATTYQIVAWNNGGTQQRHFRGYLDEMRMSNVLRSEDWMAAQYMSMTDVLLTYGAQEEN